MWIIKGFANCFTSNIYESTFFSATQIASPILNTKYVWCMDYGGEIGKITQTTSILHCCCANLSFMTIYRGLRP